MVKYGVTAVLKTVGVSKAFAGSNPVPSATFERITMETVKATELSNLRMAGGNEKKYQAVIDNGILKEWVAIGWVDVRDATEEDFKKFPVVTRV